MKKIQNTFAISGFIASDAEVKSFSAASVARFPISVSRSEKKGNETVYHSALITIEVWKKTEKVSELDILKKSRHITVEGYFRPEEWEKDGKKQSRVVLTATKFYPTPEESK